MTHLTWIVLVYTRHIPGIWNHEKNIHGIWTPKLNILGTWQVYAKYVRDILGPSLAYVFEKKLNLVYAWHMTISKISFGSLAYTSHNLRYTIHANRFVIQENRVFTCFFVIPLNNEPIRMYGISEVMLGICQTSERYLRNGHMSGIWHT